MSAVSSFFDKNANGAVPKTAQNLSEEEEAERAARRAHAQEVMREITEVEALGGAALVREVVAALADPQWLPRYALIWVAQTRMSPHPAPRGVPQCGHADQYLKRVAFEWLISSLESAPMVPWMMLPDNLDCDGARVSKPVLYFYSHTASSLLPHVRVEVIGLPLRARVAVKQMLVAGAWHSSEVLMPMRAVRFYNHEHQQVWRAALEETLRPPLLAWLRENLPEWPHECAPGPHECAPGPHECAPGPRGCPEGEKDRGPPKAEGGAREETKKAREARPKERP